MPARTVTLGLAGALLASGVAGAAERPARSRLFPDALPAGAHLPQQAGCDGPEHARAPREDGFCDFGNGTTVRVGGRAGTEFGVRR